MNNNDEVKIAEAILDAQKTHEESYTCMEDAYGEYKGEYKKDMESCLLEACKKNKLSSNLWALLNLAMHWYNDIQLWAEDILAGRDVSANMNCPCDSASKEACEQCQETGIANPLNQT